MVVSEPSKVPSAAVISGRFAKKPLITAALGTFDGSLTTIRAHETNEQGEFNPTYRCLFPEAPPPGTVPGGGASGNRQR